MVRAAVAGIVRKQASRRVVDEARMKDVRGSPGAQNFRADGGYQPVSGAARVRAPLSPGWMDPEVR